MNELQPAVSGQVRFVLNLGSPAQLKALGAVVLVVYAIQEEQILNSDVSIVPVRQSSAEGPENTRLLLPFIANEFPIVAHK